MAVPNRTGSVKNLAPPPVKMPERKDLDDTGTAPMSPTSPWGLNAVQKKQFEWPAALGNFTFDTTDAACEPFGLFHNDRVLFTKGQWNGQKAIVLGVTNGVLWVQLDEEEYAKDLKGCHNAEDTKTKYGAVLLEEEVVEQAFPVSPQHPKMEFVGARDEQELKAFQYSGPMGLYTFNCTREATEPFSFYHGQRIRATRGAYRSRCATVIGVLNGALWIHLDGDKGASPCHFCSNKDDLEAKYGWKVLNPISPRPAGHLADSPHIPANKIEYRGPFGMTYLYERSDEALKPYGLRHGQLVKLNRGISSGKKAVVIGVQAGSLWLHVEGDRAATACTFCSSFEDLEERYKITLLPDLMTIDLRAVPWRSSSPPTVGRPPTRTWTAALTVARPTPRVTFACTFGRSAGVLQAFRFRSLTKTTKALSPQS
ncbi:U-box domain-containing protein 37 [Diplonema papillatum]|nr:U-box domain-containing protein 37 [Diplonema papillatum]